MSANLDEGSCENDGPAAAAHAWHRVSRLIFKDYKEWRSQS